MSEVDKNFLESPGRRAVGALLVGGFLGLATSGCNNDDKRQKGGSHGLGTGGTERALEDSEYMPHLLKIQEIQKYFKENKKKLMSMGRGAKKHPWPAVEMAKEVNEKFDELNNALDAIAQLNKRRASKDQIKFHPKVFHGATAIMNTAINALKSRRNSKIKKLHYWAGKFQKSANGFGVVEWIAKKSGYQPRGTTALSRQIKLIQKNLRDSKKKMAPLADHTINGFSSDTKLNLLMMADNAFKTRRKVSGVMAQQECLIDNGYLDVGDNDGEGGGKTKSALKKSAGKCD